MPNLTPAQRQKQLAIAKQQKNKSKPKPGQKGAATGSGSGQVRYSTPTPAKPKPKPNMDRPGLRYEKYYDTQAPRSAYGLKPKPSSGTTRASAPSRSSTPSRSSAPARPAAASRPAAKPKPKAPAKAKPTGASKPSVAQTSGIGPVASGAEYASKKGSISESVRQLREMRAASTRRQTGQAAPALSGSKDYSSQFKDLKGGSARFTAELKKKKKLF